MAEFIGNQDKEKEINKSLSQKELDCMLAAVDDISHEAAVRLGLEKEKEKEIETPFLDELRERELAKEPLAKVANSRQVGGSHYKDMGVQPWNVIDTWPIEQQIGYYRGNALKYIMRMGSKDVPEKEVKKAQHYCEKLFEVLTNDA